MQSPTGGLINWRELFDAATWGMAVLVREPPLDEPLIAVVNGAFARMHGFDERELRGRNLCDLLGPPARARLHPYLSADGQQGGRPFESLHIRKDGSLFPVEVSRAELRGELPHGRVLAIHVHETASRKTTEADRARYFEMSLDLHCVSSADGYFKRVSPSISTILGWTSDEFLSRPFLDFVHPDDVAATLVEVERQLVRGEKVLNFTNRYRHKDGSWRVLSWRSVPGGDGLMYATARDISDQHQLEAAHARLAEIVDASVDAVMSRTLDGSVTTWNRGAERLFGYTAEEIVGRPMSILYADGASGGEAAELERVARGERIESFDTVRRTKDGRTIDVSISFSPLRDHNGTVNGIAKIARDIGARKKLEAELRHARDMAVASNQELEAFSYSVAHDLRAPLRSVDGFSKALLEDYSGSLDEGGRRYLSLVRTEAQRMGQLIDDLLQLSRVARTVPTLERVNLSKLAHECVARLRLAEPGRKVDVSIEEGMEVDGDSGLLQIALANLLGNAWKFSGKTAVARIDFGCTSTSGEQVYFVRDNGAGFDPAYSDKLFGVFQRLHTGAEFEGTGVGLAIVQRAIGRLRGRVWAEAAVGSGATFYFTLNEAKEKA